ncbi:GntR family transcriptional regulator [Chloroflexus sp.]|uniref:GntR family transcriptional regulator n=1 Tax=Chloroflexus sp. TaxID=1904827 RepID=UPI00262B1424|nr:GntR family transcriptional regulator [uncultured Chloroflexus sp.]
MGVTRLQLPTTLREATVEHLREEIVTGNLRPGEVLKDAELAAQLGLSPTPVREALVQLASEGLVEIQPNKLKRVAPLDLEMMRELYAVQRVLWQTGYSWGMPKLTPADFDAMGNALAEQVAAIERKQPRAVLMAHTDFHSVIVAASKNRELGRLIADRYPLLERLILLCMPEVLSPELLSVNQAIYTALQEGDHARAMALGERIRASFADELDRLIANQADKGKN